MALEILFWLSVALIVYAHVGYALVLRALTEGAQTPGVEVRYQGGLFAAGL